jgi:hypothetical protein
MIDRLVADIESEIDADGKQSKPKISDSVNKMSKQDIGSDVAGEYIMEVARLKPRPSGRGYSRQFLHNPPPMAQPDIPRQPTLLTKRHA